MLEAKESEITSLKEIISNMENNQVGFNSTMMRVLDSKNELISNSTEIISQLNAIKLTLEKTVKDKSAQLELLERTVHHQINQFEDEIKRMKEENLQMKQFLEFERDIWKQSLNDKSEELKQIEKTNQNNVNKLKQSNEECKYLKLTNQSNQQRLSQLNENIDDYRQMAKECGVCHEVNKLKQQLNNLIEENVNLKLQLVKARDTSKQDKCKCPELNFNGQSNHENGNQLLVKENDHLKQALRSIQHVVDKLKKNAANISDKYCQIVTTE